MSSGPSTVETRSESGPPEWAAPYYVSGYKEAWDSYKNHMYDQGYYPGNTVAPLTPGQTSIGNSYMNLAGGAFDNTGINYTRDMINGANLTPQYNAPTGVGGVGPTGYSNLHGPMYGGGSAQPPQSMMGFNPQAAAPAGGSVNDPGMSRGGSFLGSSQPMPSMASNGSQPAQGNRSLGIAENMLGAIAPTMSNLIANGGSASVDPFLGAQVNMNNVAQAQADKVNMGNVKQFGGAQVDMGNVKSATGSTATGSTAQGTAVDQFLHPEMNKTLNGEYLNANPYTQQVIDQAIRKNQATMNSAAGNYGAYGGSDFRGLSAQQAGDIAANIGYQNYGDERNRMMQAMGYNTQAGIASAGNMTNADIASARNLTDASIASANNLTNADIASMNSYNGLLGTNASLANQAGIASMNDYNNLLGMNAQLGTNVNMNNASMYNDALGLNASLANSAGMNNQNTMADLSKFNENIRLGAANNMIGASTAAMAPYESAYDRQMRAAAMMPTYESMGYNRLNTAAGYQDMLRGYDQSLINDSINRYDYNNNAHLRNLQNYFALINGNNIGGVTTGTQPAAGGGGILGGIGSGLMGLGSLGLMAATGGTSAALMPAINSAWNTGGSMSALLGI